MHGQIAIGVAATLVNIAVHAVIMATVRRVVHRTSVAIEAERAQFRLVLVMIATVSVLMAAHLIEIAVWAIVYWALGAVPQGADAFYFAFVNYTTLGYGDILPVERWRLLGPMAAMSGVLLFGWSSAVIYDVLRTIARLQPPSRAQN